MPQVMVITGATGAIASATAKALARQGHDLALLGRSQDKLSALRQQILQEAPATRVQLYPVDFSDLPRVRRAALELREAHEHIHALLHVAAVFKQTRTVTSAGLETMFTVNHLAPLLLTRELTETLQRTAKSRILTVTAPSTTRIDFQDVMGLERFQALRAFGASKMANLLFAFKLARSGLVSHAFYPGLVRSELMNEASPLVRVISGWVSRPPARAGHALGELATSDRFLQPNGQFFNLTRPIRASPYAYDVGPQDRLWEASLELLDGVETAGQP
ncbi:SDR family NAD(P)-dependent oxidoreductase [Deinococcus yavapaiensis]|uniref:Short-subunit dehydrogenase n=1 Tax=Deinococcus yavapaiensis KR-236 TaxID=694435 RepID=A0A318SAY2_9DEIO|nr:SDR family NAD(P)-dependent oxidoreductase [Deinococcus yavapaiensis]PYE55380.1 short-subunit dehydrogenase [Deinococcus yavapaiensis KR-236]